MRRRITLGMIKLRSSTGMPREQRCTNINNFHTGLVVMSFTIYNPNNMSVFLYIFFFIYLISNMIRVTHEYIYTTHVANIYTYHFSSCAQTTHNILLYICHHHYHPPPLPPALSKTIVVTSFNVPSFSS